LALAFAAACASGTVESFDASPEADTDAATAPSIDAAAPAPDAANLLQPGEVCTGDGQCATDHCENGYCCAAGDCCAGDGDCDAYDVAAACDDSASCQGTRIDGVCTAKFQCMTAVVDDDSACDGLEANDCGVYPSVTCTAEADQPVDQAALCPTTCAVDTECDTGTHCDAPSCVPDVGTGGLCDEPSDCTSGLMCIDGVCCTTSCSGVCRACNVPGSLGVCANVPDGTDPALECGAIGCAGFFAGWTGSTCYRKSDVTAAGATCGGDAMCRSQAEECAAQTATTATLTCGPADMPDLATCMGSTAGACVPMPCTTVEDFESGAWPASGWTSVLGGGTVSASFAHDGSFGVRDPDWHYKSSPTVLADTGSVLSAWTRGGTGRVYIGFDASGAGAKSFVLAPNTGDIRFQENASYGYVELTSTAFSFTAGVWYYVEIEDLGGNTLQGRVYASDGATLLGSVSHTFGSRSPGGVALRSFSGHDVDTIVHCN
jgi:hypothetical protein